MNELALTFDRQTIAAGEAELTGSGRAVCSARHRTCIGCRRACAREDLVRLIAGKDGAIVFDLKGGAWGRGAWVHPRSECLTKSVRGLARALRQPIRVTASELHEELVSAAWRRIGRLVAAARQSGQLRVGIEASEHAWGEHSVALLLVAHDADPATNLQWVAEAGAQGRVLVTPSKASMSEWLGEQDMDLAAITELRLATAIARNAAIAVIPAPARTSRGSDKGTEVG
jgi:predicted RNA-binding protein YlxR (DUF448 family)